MARIIVGGEPSDLNLAKPLYARFAEAHGAPQVFGVASPTSGEDYHEAFERELGSCLTVVIFVGPSWRDGVPPHTRWLLERATARNLTIVLVAVGGVTATASIASAVSSLSANNRRIRTLNGSDLDVVDRLAMEVRTAELLQEAKAAIGSGRVEALLARLDSIAPEPDERVQELRRQVEAVREQRRAMGDVERRQEHARHRAEQEESRRRAEDASRRRAEEEEFRRRAEEDYRRTLEERARAEAERQAAEERRVEMERRAFDEREAALRDGARHEEAHERRVAEDRARIEAEAARREDAERRARAAAEEEYRRALEVLAAERRRRDDAKQQSRDDITTETSSQPSRPVEAPAPAPPAPSPRRPTVLTQPAPPPASTPPASVSQPAPAPPAAPAPFARFKNALGGLVGSLFTRKASAPRSDAVKCTVFAPAQVRPGDSVLVQVFAHTPDADASVREMARGYDPSATARGAGLLTREVARGTRLTFSLRVPGATVDDPVQQLSWRGSTDAAQFGVSVPATQAPGNLIGTVTVSDGSVPIGRVKFVMTVVAANATTFPDARAPQSWKRYEHAFISYASSDRDEVLKRVQMLRRLHIDVFQDLLSLEPGERWEKALYKHIDESDVFFLFWSSAAKQSEWVIKEVRYAIARHQNDDLAPPEVVPVIIEGPPPVLPPPELQSLHFNDPVMYFVGR